jgi:phospho-N-acetylmuramoyl-pentapeptide-transferase
MIDILLYILGTMVLSIIWAPLLIKTLMKLNVTRNLNKDFSALVGNRYLKAGTPIMGGLLIVVTVAIVTLMFNLNGQTKIPLLVMLLSAGLGGLDDLLNIFGRKRIIRSTKKHIKLAKIHKSKIKRLWLWLALPWNIYQNMWFALGSYPGTGIHAGEKIIIQIITGAAVAWWLWLRLGWSTVWIPILDIDLELGIMMPVFITFTVVSMANAVNISDGMDGLASGISLIAFIAFLIIAKDTEGEMGMVMSKYLATVIGALIAYTYFNIKPARFQMGDVGSLAIGAMLATVAFALNKALLLPIIGFVFVAEIGSSLIQGVYRRVTGMRLFKMAPVHLHFQLLGWSEEKIVMRFWIFGIVFALVGLLVNYL